MVALSYTGDPTIQIEMVQLLLDCSCPINQVTHKAAQYGQHEFKPGWSALMLACERGCHAVVKLVALKASSSVSQHMWNHRLWVGAVLVARLNSRHGLASQLQGLGQGFAIDPLPARSPPSSLRARQHTHYILVQAQSSCHPCVEPKG